MNCLVAVVRERGEDVCKKNISFSMTQEEEEEKK